MRKPIEFRYFPEYEKWARFSNDNCLCQDDIPCLEAIYFENPDIENPVCLDLLVDGYIKVEIPDYLHKQLINSILLVHPQLNDNQAKDLAAPIVNALSRTPPIPWVQSNAWPVCCGDFCCYLGEWNYERLMESAPDGDGSAFIWNILDNNYRSRRDTQDNLWQEIKNEWAIIYIFQCFECNKLIAIDQNY